MVIFCVFLFLYLANLRIMKLSVGIILAITVPLA